MIYSEFYIAESGLTGNPTTTLPRQSAVIVLQSCRAVDVIGFKYAVHPRHPGWCVSSKHYSIEQLIGYVQRGEVKFDLCHMWSDVAHGLYLTTCGIYEEPTD